MSTTTTTTTEQYGLAEPQMLYKIDKLFACGVGELVNLPQIVVVGDQSSGKSSVLEGLINKPLPRDSGLCTRFATHIVFRRAAEDRIVVSIKTDRQASSEHRDRVRGWNRAIPSLDPDTFKKIMQEAHEAMGLSEGRDEREQKPTFSNDVLLLEISGPGQEHLSVIDVPGLFQNKTEGLTTKEDIQLVRNMVIKYMKNPRSVMLAVIPANVDTATQGVLDLATEFDPDGDRTLGVLTKPDLVDEGAESEVVNVVEGRNRPMKLGWHIIRSPGQKDLQDLTLDRSQLEASFFCSEAPWDGIDKEKVGVDALRFRLKDVLSSLVKREFPKVKAEIQTRLVARHNRLAGLGPERTSSAEQMAYLTRLATKFQRLVSLALNATHGADEAFQSKSALRIAPAIMSRMKAFSDEMARYGETYSFASLHNNDSSSTLLNFAEDDDDNAAAFVHQASPAQTFEIRKEDDLEDIIDLLYPQISLPHPREGKVKNWLLAVFQDNRGFELGTFNASILATAMKKQCSKWKDISLGFVSDIIVMVHRFIDSALASICHDRSVREALMDKLSYELIQRYRKAITTTNFLLAVENSDTPMTLNHYFNDNLQKSRQSNASARIKKNAFHNGSHGYVVKLDQVMQGTRSMSNEEHMLQDIHDILQSYYKVSRKTFVDCVSKHSAVHHLLQGEDSPLALFSPTFVSDLSILELEEIAGEALALKKSRAQLTKEIASLTEAMKILVRA